MCTWLCNLIKCRVCSPYISAIETWLKKISRITKWLTIKFALFLNYFFAFFCTFQQKIHLESQMYFPLGLFGKKVSSYSAAVSLEEIGFTTRREFCGIHHPQVSQSLHFWRLKNPQVLTLLKRFPVF